MNEGTPNTYRLNAVNDFLKGWDSIETRSLPALTRSYPRRFYVDHSHCLGLAPATLAALPSTHAIPDRDVFHVALPKAPFGLSACPPMPATPQRPRRRVARGPWPRLLTIYCASVP